MTTPAHDKTPERMEFQAETRQLLDLMIHSLYKHKEIFLRELLSNASDALDKLRFESLTRPELQDGDERMKIRLEPDSEAKTLKVIDTGIGMTRDEVVANIGTIARSGTKEFARKLRQSESAGGAAIPELIGQFGVGFYSAFMVADEVVLETRKAGEREGVRWASKGDGTFTVEAIDKPERGTTVTLHLKAAADGEEDFQDFTAKWRLREIVKRYSDFVAWPIEMDELRQEGEEKDKKAVLETVVLNSMKPLWTRAPHEVKPEEHAEFYKHFTHDWEEPQKTIHFRAEGSLEYTALLYLPKHRPLALLEQDRAKSHVALYVKRVFILADCEELLPPWLRFVRGLVDSNDLPLNVSRETLQHTRQMAPIKKRLTGKVLDTLKKMLEDERPAYLELWKQFGSFIKEGLYYEDELRPQVAAVCLFHGSKDESPCTLKEYCDRMPFAQKEIYYLAGTDREVLKRSPYLEAFQKKGFEVLFLTDPADEFAIQRLTEFEGKSIKSIERGEVSLESDEEKEQRTKAEEERKPLLEAVKETLGERVEAVRFSNRLTDSAAVLVSGEHDLTPHMRRMLKEAQQGVPDAARVLELNAAHPLVARMQALKDGGDDARFKDYCELVLGQAQLAEGSPLEDPARFNRLVSGLMLHP